MRAPFGCEVHDDVCPDDKGILDPGNEGDGEIFVLQHSLEKKQGRKSAMFGICLDDLMGTSARVAPRVPFVLSRLCQYIEKYGLNCKSLFVEGDEKSVVESLKVEFIEFGDAQLEQANSIPAAAKLIVVFLQELPEPLIPASAQADFIQGMQKLTLRSQDGMSCLKSSVESLPDTSYEVLKYLSKFLGKVACHEDQNCMSCSALAKIFGPLVFRSATKDVCELTKFNHIMIFFIQDYYDIFEEKSSKQFSSTQQCRVSKLLPLTVVIPPTETKSSEAEFEDRIPVLLIEGQLESSNDNNEKGVFKVPSDMPGSQCTRKRKERRFSGEDPQLRSSSEERPSGKSLTTSLKLDLLRRCNSHEEGIDERGETGPIDILHVPEDEVKNAIPEESGKSCSPHPPNPKRREVETASLQPNFDQSRFAWDRSPNYQNLVVELPDEMEEEIAECEDSVFSDGTDVPRSVSCPIPGGDSGEEPSESGSLSLSWSMLFEDSEPVRSEHPLNLQLDKDMHADEALLSPSVQKLRNQESYEAPLSPSAYRSYLSHRSSHLDSSVPPSPPVEQEDFVKKLGESSIVLDSIKQLTKKIHVIKKRIKKFEEKFEAEHGYKPSHVEKTNHRDGKKLLHDLNKARRDIKILKEEAHLDHVSSVMTWHSDRYSHILEDSTNRDRSKPTVEESLGQTMLNLSDERKSANRPDCVDDMSSEQVQDEKVAIQKALLHFESIHGKPTSREARTVVRPLYDRYRSVKRMLVRSGSFPGAVAKSKELCNELQPILEHETMEFPLRERTESVEVPEEGDDIVEEESEKTPSMTDEQMTKSINTFMTKKYDNSNLHELSLSELILQSQVNRSEKRRLRKALRDFEMEFVRLNGSKPQKEDKTSMEVIYSQYKHVKARLRLLEALISKHEQHQLM